MSDEQASKRTDIKMRQIGRRRLKLLAVLLSVGTIFYLLVLWIEPGVQSARSGPRKGAAPHLKNIALAQKNHASQMEGRFALPTVVNTKGEPVFGWYVRLLPLTGEASRYDQIQFEFPYNHPNNSELFQGSTNDGIELVPEIKQTIDEDGYGLIHFTLNERLFPGNQSLTEGFISGADGLGNTILLGEIEQGLPAWGAPGNARDPALGLKPGPNSFGVSVHDGVTIIGFADGRATTINNDINPEVLKALSTPDGGEDIPEDY